MVKFPGPTDIAKEKPPPSLRTHPPALLAAPEKQRYCGAERGQDGDDHVPQQRGQDALRVALGVALFAVASSEG